MNGVQTCDLAISKRQREREKEEEDREEEREREERKNVCEKETEIKR